MVEKLYKEAPAESEEGYTRSNRDVQGEKPGFRKGHLLAQEAHRSTLGVARRNAGIERPANPIRWGNPGGLRMRTRPLLSITVLGLLLAIGGCAKAPNDAGIVTNIKSQMFSDPQLKDSALQVTSNKGVVTIAGTVPNDAARLDAYKIATQTAGVTKVNDQMTVQPAQAAAPAEAPAVREAPKKSPEPVRKPVHKKHAVKTEIAENVPPAPKESPAAPEPAPAPAPAPQPAAAPPTPPPPSPPPQPKQVQIPAGTTITIRMIDSVDSSANHPGEVFHASLDAPIVVNNEVVVPKDADVYVRLVNAASAGRLTGKSELSLELVKLEFQGQSYPLVSSTYNVSGSSRGSNTAKKVGVGAVLGTLLGAVAGGGKGAAIGAAAGAGGGAVWNGVTHGKEIKIPSETKLDFQLDQPTTVTIQPRITTGASN